MDHLTPDQIDALLNGDVLSDPVGVRGHVAECDACARHLAAGARFELQLEHAARLAVARRTVRARVAFAAAAALVLLAVGFAVRLELRRHDAALTGHGLVTPIAVAIGPGSPGLSDRIPRLCEDVMSPADFCRFRDDTGPPAGQALQAPARREAARPTPEPE